MDSHNPPREYLCDECGASFQRRDSLGPHYKSKHPDVEIPTEILTNDNSKKLKPVKFHVRGKKTKSTSDKPSTSQQEEDPVLALAYQEDNHRI